MDTVQAAARHASGVDRNENKERMLLEAELFQRDAQLRCFGPIRDRLAAAGKDPMATYQKIASRRHELARTLQRPRAVTVGSSQPILAQSLLELPLAPMGMFGNPAKIGLGYSGFVQMGHGTDGYDEVPRSTYASGDIATVRLRDDGFTIIGGVVANNHVVEPAQFDPTIEISWQHSWEYIVPFPAPPVTSNFTCRVDMHLRIHVERNGGMDAASLSVFLKSGGIPNYEYGFIIPLDPVTQWPLSCDLTQPGLTTGGIYNGSVGFIEATVPVQHSFVVGAGQTPALGIEVGMICGLGEGVDYPQYIDFDQSSIVPLQPGGSAIGRAAFYYEPLPFTEH